MRDSDRRAPPGSASDLIRIADVVRAVVKRLWVVLTVEAGALVIAVLALALIEPAYTASTTLIVVGVEGATLDYNSVQLNRNLARTYVEVARSRTVATMALEALGLNEPPQGLQERVRVTTIGETELILIAVTDSNPDQAARIANTLAEAFREHIRVSMQVDNVRVIDEAASPAAPVSPRPMLMVTVLGLLGLCAGAGLALLMDQHGRPFPRYGGGR